LGANSRLASHVVIEGQTSIGENCEFASFCVVGGEPQDKKHDKHNPAHVRASELRMGSGCTVREYVTGEFSCGLLAFLPCIEYGWNAMQARVVAYSRAKQNKYRMS
jgi:hypothetical protein